MVGKHVLSGGNLKRRVNSSIAWLTTTSLVLALVQPAAVLAAPAQLFFDSFGSTSTNTVAGWVESEVSISDARIETSFDRPGSSTTGNARLRLDGMISKTVSTLGHTNITLEYFWRGDNDAESNDFLKVSWRPSGGGEFTPVNAHVLNGGCVQGPPPSCAWSSAEIVSLPAGANDGSIDIRFWGDSSATNEEARIDDVRVTGDIVNTTSISGVKYNDLNGDGDRDAGEPSLQGWTINLSGPVSDSTVTNSNGEYEFSNLPAGTYTVCETLEATWTQTAPSSGPDCGNGTLGHTVVLTESASGVDFGNIQYGSITVEKQTLPDGSPEQFTFKLNGNNNQTIGDGDTYTYSNLVAGSYDLAEQVNVGWDLTDISCSDGSNSSAIDLAAGEHVTCTFTNTKRGSITVVKVADPDDDTPFQFNLTGDNLLDQTIVNGSGTYTFVDLTPGSYALAEDVPAGWDGTYPEAPSCTTGTPADISLAPGGNVTCTFNNTELSSISGVKFNDVNGDSVFNQGEPGLSDWTIDLTGTDSNGDPISLSTTTGVSGNYSFTNLHPGNYTLGEVLKNGWVQTAPANGTYEVILAAGEDVLGRDFGNFNLGSISGKKYDDLNGNGEDDEGELALADWTIYLDLNNNGTLDQGEPIDVTDINGRYSFNDLGPGTYTLREVLLAGWEQTDPTNADSSIGGENDGSYVVAMTSNGNKHSRNFGNFKTASVSGLKWNDENGNGVKDEGEDGIEGWEITATKGQSQKTETTDEDGEYVFTFGPGDVGIWTIAEISELGWIQTHPTEPGTYNVVVQSGVTETDKDFGNVPITNIENIEGLKWNDTNGNGTRDEGEQALADWTIALGKVGQAPHEGEPIPIEIVALSLTGGDGGFRLPVSEAGPYKLFEEQRQGWEITHPAPQPDSFFDITYHIDLPAHPPLVVDSFFDVFVELDRDTITTDINQHELAFGNRQIVPPVDDDQDNDGFTTANDCNDDNASIYPGASEVLNGLDDDCDGLIDEGLGDESSDDSGGTAGTGGGFFNALITGVYTPPPQVLGEQNTSGESGSGSGEEGTQGGQNEPGSGPGGQVLGEETSGGGVLPNSGENEGGARGGATGNATGAEGEGQPETPSLESSGNGSPNDGSGSNQSTEPRNELTPGSISWWWLLLVLITLGVFGWWFTLLRQKP